MSTTVPTGRHEKRGEEEASFTQDTMLELLCNERRRHAIRYLLSEGKTTLQEMVNYVTAVEVDAPAENAQRTKGSTVYESLSHPAHDPARREKWRKERKSVYASLRQHHLPRLQKEDVIRFDTESGTVKATRNTLKLRRLLAAPDGAAPASHGRDGTGDPVPAAPASTDRERGTRWLRYYAALCLVSWSIAFLDTFDIVSYELITSGGWVLLFLLKLTVLVALHTYSLRDPGGTNPLVP